MPIRAEALCQHLCCTLTSAYSLACFAQAGQNNEGWAKVCQGYFVPASWQSSVRHSIRNLLRELKPDIVLIGLSLCVPYSTLRGALACRHGPQVWQGQVRGHHSTGLSV